ncbi:MAG TPA: hypothetical protein VGZ91_07065 [Candidatus Sulfotelmatobacter sp.]|jgi:hypothetical protein|nr:hypothetical protein [Candidatus Sulfotelmatobacter sp.]
MRKVKRQNHVPKEAASSQADAQAQLDFFLAKYAPDVVAFAYRTLAKNAQARPRRSRDGLRQLQLVGHRL